MALRWMTGCDKLDIAPHHGLGLREVMESLWQVVDLVNNCEKLKIKFPATHEEQQKNTDGFEEKSKSGFGSWANKAIKLKSAKSRNRKNAKLRKEFGEKYSGLFRF